VLAYGAESDKKLGIPGEVRDLVLHACMNTHTYMGAHAYVGEKLGIPEERQKAWHSWRGEGHGFTHTWFYTHTHTWVHTHIWVKSLAFLES
jgi:hypothetical protein